MLNLVYCYLFLFAFMLASLFVPWVRRLAFHLNMIDQPEGRKAHDRPTPLLGGLAIYTAFSLALLVQIIAYLLLRNSLWFSNYFPFLAIQFRHFTEVLPQLLAMGIGATMMVILGLIDDYRGMGFSYKIKFVFQIMAAGILVVAGIRTDFMPSILLNSIVTVAWVVGITNAFNLLDNMDGLSAGIAGIAAAIFFVITAAQGQVFSAMIFSLFLGATLGFLLHNFYPAKIFMGDTGSLFLGYVLAALSITSSYVVPQSINLLPVLTPLLILSLPIFDTLSVMIIRYRERRPLFIGDRRHFSHRLVELGMSQRGAVIFIYLVALSIGAAASLLPYLPLWGQILVLVQTSSIYIMITILMHVANRRQQSQNK
ncbi:MAG: undecaprenyl/decaprenyl-phosphate alpha-N-acetylglucosaminyl 1-phosphate transferase [candidate division KSB1 bacterium]|nr:undecaprenyl/decaprenyl-phosphate alpha-N-acetylglucosaminyl 1-phosphate transferase [candidate division KSB1 bacterium]MDZ7302954.1 undecaprenyl/decaprenyl-phosphate alpha-N-acetylglucosaminyl 1-phosphate transferase [candidate division KSB1 bacterium]MDZ7312230.1 undecaprenyl/decaprenyl-phosphate alpha-N-acetylglucosaminyl 1-phosphate transferase [candidate division KSB1 bacterium]